MSSDLDAQIIGAPDTIQTYEACPNWTHCPDRLAEWQSPPGGYKRLATFRSDNPYGTFPTTY